MGLMDLFNQGDIREKIYAAANKNPVPQGGATGAAFHALFPQGLGNLAFGRKPEPIPALNSPEGTQYMADLASNMMVPGTFIGPKGMSNLLGDDVARGLMSGAEAKLAQGVPREEVFRELGVFRGPEGKWRYEIDDSGMDFDLSGIPAGRGRIKVAEDYLREQGRTERWPIGNPNVPDELQSQALRWADENPDIQRGKVGQAANHQELFTAYPDAPNIDLAIEKRMGLGGSYDPADNLISVGGGTLTTNPQSTLLHELQHAVQGREGFAAGGNPNQFSLTESIEKMKESNRLFDIMTGDVAKKLQAAKGDFRALIELRKQHPEQYAEISDILNKLGTTDFDEATDKILAMGKTESPGEKYMRLAGEVEARAVQDRMNMTMPERRSVFPEYATRNDLIINGLMSGGY
jgi:hypothetical protein